MLKYNCYCLYLFFKNIREKNVRIFLTLQPARLLCPWDSPGKNTGVGGHALLQEISLTYCLLSPVLASRFFTTGATWEAIYQYFGWRRLLEGIMLLAC